MYEKWREQYPECQRSEQNLVDKVKSVLRRKVFTDVELESFKRKLLSEDNMVTNIPTLSTTVNNSNSSVTQEGSTDIIHPPLMHHLVLVSYKHVIRSKLINTLETLLECGGKRDKLPALKSPRRDVINRVLAQVNVVIKTISIQSLEQLIDIIYCAYKVIWEVCGVLPGSQEHRKDFVPPWKRRLQSRIARLNHYLN